jgi:chemotaxis protein CheC
VLTEIGNILLNACLGTFGNLLKVQVSFSVPHLTLDTLESVVSSIAVNREGLRYALIVHASFKLRDSSLRGYLVIVLGVASLERLIRSLEIWEQERQ